MNGAVNSLLRCAIISSPFDKQAIHWRRRCTDNIFVSHERRIRRIIRALTCTRFALSRQAEASRTPCVASRRDVPPGARKSRDKHLSALACEAVCFYFSRFGIFASAARVCSPRSVNIAAINTEVVALRFMMCNFILQLIISIINKVCNINMQLITSCYQLLDMTYLLLSRNIADIYLLFF